MSVAVSKMRFKKSILFMDNDLKFKIEGNLVQDLESRLKYKASDIVIPEACRKTFSTKIPRERIHTYDGFKEDFYIADFKPDPNFSDKLPFKDYIVIRPESLSSFYVDKKGSITGKLVRSFIKSDMNIVLLPRDRKEYSEFDASGNVFMPEEALNGLDLIYHSNAVLTGSGTMAREAAIMGKTAVSFFPNDKMLSVDQELIDEGRMFKSRDPQEIVQYVLSGKVKGRSNDRKSKKVKEQIFWIIKGLLG
jgi:predicted glycosyltransferase